MESNAKLTSYLVESINGISTIKAFNAEREVNSETEKRFIKFIKNIFNNGYVNNFQITLKSLVKGIFSIALLWLGTVQVIKGNISFGELLAFNALLVYFLDPIENIINLQPTVQTAIVAAERLSEILDLSLEKAEDEHKKIIPDTLNGEIEFKNLDFRYGSRSLVLKNINIEALRDKIAYISQETFLFNGTIIENLSLANPYLTYDEIIEACKKAHCESD